MGTHSDREELHFLLDRIPESDIKAARDFLRALADPLKQALLDAPLDDEPLSVHEKAAWDADRIRRTAGVQPISHKEVLSELGFSEADLQ